MRKFLADILRKRSSLKYVYFQTSYFSSGSFELPDRLASQFVVSQRITMYPRFWTLRAFSIVEKAPLIGKSDRLTIFFEELGYYAKLSVHRSPKFLRRRILAVLLKGRTPLRFKERQRLYFPGKRATSLSSQLISAQEIYLIRKITCRLNCYCNEDLEFITATAKTQMEMLTNKFVNERRRSDDRRRSLIAISISIAALIVSISSPLVNNFLNTVNPLGDLWARVSEFFRHSDIFFRAASGPGIQASGMAIQEWIALALFAILLLYILIYTLRWSKINLTSEELLDHSRRFFFYTTIASNHIKTIRSKSEVSK